jgi:hypothetical protein
MGSADKQMEIIRLAVKRRFRSAGYTIGTLYVDGVKFCDTLEDTDRGLKQDTPLDEIKAIKVKGQTAIPTGTYAMTINVSPKFNRLLPRLLDVPGFDGILIHRGNTADDTMGCILVGENKVKGKVINSTKYELDLVSKLVEFIQRGAGLTITIE